MKFYKQFSFIVACFLLIITNVGCDQIAAISEYFKKSEKPETQQSVQIVEKSTVKGSSENSQAPLPANTLASVGSWSITVEEFKDRLKALKEVAPNFDVENKEGKSLVLEELVRQQLLVEEAQQTGLTNQKDIKAAVEEFRRTLIVREAAKKLTENITVTDEEAKAFYEEKKDLLVEPMQWHVREIVFDTQEKANEILIEILKGVDFTETAKQHSVGKSAVNEGDLGFINDVPFAQMANPLLALDTGDVSSVFKGPEGFYIIKLEEKKGGEALAFEDIKEEIINNQMLLKQQQAILNHLEQLKQKIKVEVNEQLLK